MSGHRPATAGQSVGSARPLTYFVHIPKTAGITLTTYLQNNYAHGESLVIEKEKARALPADELDRYRLFSGHYSSEVLQALAEPPDVTIVVVRDPVARLRSWAAHGRRSRRPEYRALVEGRSDVEVLRGERVCDAFQAYWLARGLRDGARSKRVPGPAELPDLLDRVDLVGLTEHLPRLMQLVAFRMGWPAPPLGWHINRRPDQASGEPPADVSAEDAELRSLLAIDVELYALAESRFWASYVGALAALDPARTPYTREAAAAVPIDTVQHWLRQHHRARSSGVSTGPVSRIQLGSDEPIAGEGWWWRERPGGLAYRWTGPSADASLQMAPLAEGTAYDMTMELMGAADWPTWNGVRVEVNGHPLRAVRERFGPFERGGVSLRLHARLTPQVVAAQRGGTHVVLRVPESRPTPGGAIVLESEDTPNRDRRLVGLAVHRLRIEPALW